MRRLAGLILWLLLPSAAHAATIFHDTFTGPNGTNLEAHTPEIGTSWTEEYSTATGQIDIQSNTIQSEYSGGSDGSFQKANGTYPHGNYTVTAVFSTIDNGSGARNAWIGCRYANSGGFDGYFASIAQQPNTNDVVIYRVDNGTPTKISGTEDTNPTTGDTFVLECKGSQIGLKKNGSYVINPITDATYSTGVAIVGFGEILGLTSFGTGASGNRIDTFTVETIDTGNFFLKRRAQ